MVSGYCVGLEHVRRGDLSAVGGKAANLGELIAGGFAVPPGFVVTTAAYRLACDTVGSQAEIAAREVPREVADAVARSYESLGRGAVAVRSSATAEDLPGATFAGQQDTYLGVDGTEAVIAAVRDCWASLWSDRAIAYRQRLGIEPETVQMGVVVQRLVRADSAGVMFTADPVTGARDRVVVNASAGLGEAVVSGSVTPEHLVVTDDDRILERRGQDAAAPPAVLTDDRAVELARTGRRIAAWFGRPQDIEWASDEGRFLIVQSRAMTGLPPPPIPLNLVQRVVGPVLVELLPRRPYPMELTGWIIPTVTRHVDEMIAGLTGARVRLATALPASDAVVQQFIPPTPRPTLKTPIRLIRTVIRGLRHSSQEWTSDPRLLTYRAGVAALDRVDLKRLSWEELTAVPRRAAELADLVTALRIDHLPGGFVALARLTVVLRLTGRTDLVPALVGGVPTSTIAANGDLARLARDAAGIPALRELLGTGDDDRIHELALALPEAAGWWDDLGRFLDTYGHRETTSLLLVRDPSWRDSPQTVLALIRMLLDEAAPGGTTRDHGPPAAPPALLSKRIRRLAERAAAGVAFREDSHFELTRTMPAVRRAIAEAGRRLAEAGALDAPQDVWLLTLDELTGALPGPAGAATTRNLRAATARRRAAYDEFRASPLIAPTTLYPHRTGSDAALVVGTPGGGGRVTGRVRIIRGPEEFADLRAGEVLVCATTNPSWTPLFQRAAAVVVDHGGIGSHAAIVAREYGIPAVLGTGTATSVLASTLPGGRQVLVDGDLGEVLAVEVAR